MDLEIMSDLSIFPILRIDQLKSHETETLLRAEQALGISVDLKHEIDTESCDHLGKYCLKLLGAIQTELALRRVRNLINRSYSHNRSIEKSSIQCRLETIAHSDCDKMGDDNEPITTKLTSTFVAADTLIVAPVQRKGLRHRATAIFRAMKSKQRDESLWAHVNKSAQRRPRDERKALFTRLVTAKKTTKLHPLYARPQHQLQSSQIIADDVRDLRSGPIDNHTLPSIDASGDLLKELVLLGSSAQPETEGCSINCELSAEKINDEEQVNRNNMINSVEIDALEGARDCSISSIVGSDGQRRNDETQSRSLDMNNTGDDSIKNICLNRYDSNHIQVNQNQLDVINIQKNAFTENEIIMTDLETENDRIKVNGSVLQTETKEAKPTSPYYDDEQTDSTLDASALNAETKEPEPTSSCYDHVQMDSKLIDRMTKEKADEQSLTTQATSKPLRLDVSYTETFSPVFQTFECIFNFYDDQQNYVKLSHVNCKTDNGRILEALSYQVSINAHIQNMDRLNLKENDFVMYPFNFMQSEESIRFYKVQSKREELISLITDTLDDERLGKWHKLDPIHLHVDHIWNLHWTWSIPKFKARHLLCCQRINRFRFTKCLIRKDLLKKKLTQFRCSEVDLKGCDLMPYTFNLPSEYTLFVAAFKSYQKSGPQDCNTWIMKPAGMSRGRGIFLVDDICDVCYSMPFVAQKYITNPLLYNGYKFDLRLYVLVTSFHPLEVFLHEEGFARFSIVPYSCSHDSLGDPRIHLTNSSVQANFLSEMSISHPVRLADKDGGGSKVRLSWLWRRLKSENKDVSLLKSRIRDACLKVLQSVDTEIPFQPNSFEVFGFDVLIDDSLKIWVLEVNGSPSMSRDYPLDSDIKENLIKDTIALIDPAPVDRSALIDVCKERLRQLNGRSIDRGAYYCKRKLTSDLRRIFPRGPPRQYGEMPKYLGGFQRLFPK